MSRAIAAEVRPLKPNQQQARSQSAHEIHDRLIKSTAATRTMWPHQAQAIADMRNCKGWKDLNYESMAEWLTQPEINMKPSWARKLAGMLEVFTDRGATIEQLADCDPSNLAITVRAVRAGEAEFERAIADVKSMHRSELEIRYSEDPDAPLNADDEPEKWKCPQCYHVHARLPKHLDDSEPEEPDHYPAAPAEDEGTVF